MIKVLFVCLGNICRSPMAEGIFQDLLEKNNLTDRVFCDSAGTSAYHVGNLPDIRMIRTAEKHGVVLPSKARQLVLADYHKFDYILAMDDQNLSNIHLLFASEKTTKRKPIIKKMREYDHMISANDVDDPYYGGNDGFENVYQVLLESNLNLLKEISNQL